jgi:hypothetical protein
MRYAKDTIAVSEDRDIPVLLQARNSRFITHHQLFELMRLAGSESSRRSFNWRIQRLVDSNYISVCDGNFGYGSQVYRITRQGLMQLERHGHFAAVLNSATLHLPHLSHIHHALELKAIQVVLARANVLASWQSDVETASSNTVSTAPLEKDYDAVVDVWNHDKIARFALEYERTLKNSRHYERIRQALEAEDKVGCILYLTPGEEMAFHLAQELSGIPKRLAFTTAPAFRKGLLDTMVVTHPSHAESPFRHLLRGMF